MYFPKSQIKSNQYTKGGEFQNSSTQEEYTGFYFETSTGEYYAGKNPTDFPVFPLVEINIPTTVNNLNSLNEPTSTTTKYFEWTYEYLTSPLPQEANILQPNRIYPTPSAADYTLGEFQRYFLSKTNEPKFIEVDKTQYTQYLNQDPNVAYQLYQPFNLPWVISGDRNEAYNVNKKTVERIQFQLKLRGFKSYFKERYDQFYKFPNISNLYTPGNEFKTANGRNYIGFYHIHDKTGPMVGANHIKEAHELLFPINQQPTSSAIQVTSSYSPPIINVGGGSSDGGSGGGGRGY